MRSSLAIATAAVIVTIVCIRAVHGEGEQDAARPADVIVREAYQERVKAARDVLASIDQRLEAGEALGPSMLDLQATSFKRLADAEIAAAADKGGRIEAAGQHVRRCEELLTITDTRFKAGLDTSKVQLDQAKYHLADAKVMLAEAMVRP